MYEEHARRGAFSSVQIKKVRVRHAWESQPLRFRPSIRVQHASISFLTSRPHRHRRRQPLSAQGCREQRPSIDGPSSLPLQQSKRAEQASCWVASAWGRSIYSTACSMWESTVGICEQSERFPPPHLSSLLPLRAQGWLPRTAYPEKHAPQRWCIAKGRGSGPKASETSRAEQSAVNGRRRNIVESQKLEISPGKALTLILKLYNFRSYIVFYGGHRTDPIGPGPAL